MIYLAPPFFNFDGLVVMRDDSDPLQYYYYPKNPQLALNPDGTPTFLFVRFKEDKPVPPGVEAGGGFLNFDVDLRVDSDTLDNAKREIRTQMNLDQDPRLVPLQYRAGTTRLIFLDAPPAASGTPASGTPASTPAATTPPPGTLRFVESASYAGSPSLYGDNRSTFSVALTPQGATLVSACLDAPTFLAGVVYDLTFVGLRPSFKVSLVVDWNSVYDFMENQFHASAKIAWVSLQSDIDSAVEKLIETRVIQIKVVSYAAGVADADIVKEKDSAVEFVKKMVTDSFFKPSIPPHGLSGDTNNKTANSFKEATSPVSAAYSLKMLKREDMKKLNVDLTEQDAMEVRIVPQGHLAGLMDVLKNQPRSNYIRDVDLNDPFFQRVSVEVGISPVFAVDHIDSVQVDLNYAGSNAQPQSLTLTAAAPTGKVSWELDQTVGMTYTYAVTVSFKPDAFAGSSLLVASGPLTSTTPKITIDPREHYTIENVDVEALGLPWDRYGQVEVELGLDELSTTAASQSFTLTKDSVKTSWSFRPSDPANRTFRYRKTYFPLHGPPVLVDWAPSQSPAVIISDLDTDVLKVYLTTALDFTKIPHVLVTIQYEDDKNNVFADDVIQLGSDSPHAEWALAIIDRSKRAYTYAVTLQYADHSVKVFPPVPSDARVLNILETYNQTFNVAISASGVDFATAGLDRVEVLMTYSDGSSQPPLTSKIILRSLTDTGTFTYQAHDPARLAYTYSGTYFSRDGFNRNIDSQQSDVPKLVIPIAANN